MEKRCRGIRLKFSPRRGVVRPGEAPLAALGPESETPGAQYVVSACLAGFACRYDGKSKPCPSVARLCRCGLAEAVCPESLAELPRPRPPCEQKGGRVLSRDGRDLTEDFERGAMLALQKALSCGARRAILKSRSPSCGVGLIRDGSFSGGTCPGYGVWARKLLEAGFELFTEENLPPELAGAQQAPESEEGGRSGF